METTGSSTRLQYIQLYDLNVLYHSFQHSKCTPLLQFLQIKVKLVVLENDDKQI